MVKKTSQTLAAAMLAVMLISVLTGCAPRSAQSAGPAQAAVMEGEELPAEISVNEANARVAAGAFLLDVRQPEEWNEAHVPGATLIPLGELPSRLNELPKDREIVVMCRSGNRSQAGRDILLNAGFPSAASMAGGINEWKKAGFPTTTGP